MMKAMHPTLKLLSGALIATAIAGCAAAPGATKEVIATKAAPAAIGPYSQAVKSGKTLYLSGQLGLDPKTNELAGSAIEEQGRQVLENLKAVLAANGMDLNDVVSTTVYVKDLNDFAKLNAVYAGYFKSQPPARATVQVSRLPKDALVEISAIAAQ